MFNKQAMISAEQALPGRAEKMPVVGQHFVLANALLPPYPENVELAMLGMGCFWGAERKFWQQQGVWTTAVGYAAGFTSNPLYAEVCTGKTGHNEVVRVVFNPDEISFEALLQHFWEGHDPTQGMRQGNYVGSQYRSGVYTYSDEQMAVAIDSKAHYQSRLNAAGRGIITTEILTAPEFYFAEDAHQQYLAKNPGGYCGLGGTDISYT